ncbi:MAG: hypothetical protein JO145_05865 [Acidobacteriaceae bacterium]|nr:hypothetical protein [Acidobacteriaceae bacterium]MBV9765107.1 hypothetical protein [Acidobacteriaceae bacterium]
MSAMAQTKIFGVRVGVDPKILVGGLIAVAATLFWYNSRGDDERSAPAANVPAAAPAVAAAPLSRSRLPATRRASAANDRATLRFRAIDATSGKIDPTLRLDLLQKLQTLQTAQSGRSLFEAGLTPQEQVKLTPIKGPIIPVAPHPAVDSGGPGSAGPPVVNIPLKYYGFVKPQGRSEINRGFFLDGDNIVIALEGQTISNRYLVVALTPGSARLEDTQLKQGQTLTVVPEATAQ